MAPAGTSLRSIDFPSSTDDVVETERRFLIIRKFRVVVVLTVRERNTKFVPGILYKLDFKQRRKV